MATMRPSTSRVSDAGESEARNREGRAGDQLRPSVENDSHNRPNCVRINIQVRPSVRGKQTGSIAPFSLPNRMAAGMLMSFERRNVTPRSIDQTVVAVCCPIKTHLARPVADWLYV